MLWRTAERLVKRVDLHLEDTSVLEGNSASETLVRQMENSRKQQSFKLTEVPSEVNQPCCIGAPVIMTSPDGGSAIVGINAGGRITTLHGIFAFLKGGLGHFLAAMDRKQTRTLMPSRWEHYLKSSISTLPTLSSVLDLFHHLLHRDDLSGVRILKFNVEGGPHLQEIVSGLRVYTAIFEHYRILKNDQESAPCKPCGIYCNCLDQIHSDMRKTLKHFSSIEDPPEEIAVAIFECFKTMQSFEYANMAKEILKENRERLDRLATKPSLTTNSAVNENFKMIDILARQFERLRMSSESSLQHPTQATEY